MALKHHHVIHHVKGEIQTVLLCRERRDRREFWNTHQQQSFCLQLPDSIQDISQGLFHTFNSVWHWGVFLVRCYRSLRSLAHHFPSVSRVKPTLRCNLLEHRGRAAATWCPESSSKQLLAQEWQQRARKGAVDVRNSGCTAVMRPLAAQRCGGRRQRAKGGDLLSGLCECHSSASPEAAEVSIRLTFSPRRLKTSDQWHFQPTGQVCVYVCS